VWLNERKKTRTKFEMILRKNSIENLNIFYKEYSHSIIAQAHFQFESKWTTQKTTQVINYILVCTPKNLMEKAVNYSII
jgi:hypothetical protein